MARKFIEAIEAQLCELEAVRETVFIPERTVDGRPAILRIYPSHELDPPSDDIDKDLIEILGLRIHNIFDLFIRAEVKASLEHPTEKVIEHHHGEKAEVVGLVALEHRYYISIRWNEKMATTPSDIRGPTGEDLISDTDITTTPDTTEPSGELDA